MTRDPDPSDARLLEAWRDGDRAAADAVIERHGSRLYNFFASKVPDGAEALCQQTLADCVADSEPPGPDGARTSMRAQLFTAARRRLLERLGEHEDGPPDPALRSVAELHPGVSELVSARPQQRRLVLALRRLPIDDQIALELSYWEGLTEPELAAILDAEPPRVRARLEAARARLRERLAQDRERTDHTVDSDLTEDERSPR